MQKDFDSWNVKKKKIDIVPSYPGFSNREIWYCRMGLNVGFEQDGKGDDFLRPVVIIRKFNNHIFWAIPLTSVRKDIPEHAMAYYFMFSFLQGKQSMAILSQIRLIDVKRLNHRIDRISIVDFQELTKKLKELIP